MKSSLQFSIMEVREVYIERLGRKIDTSGLKKLKTKKVNDQKLEEGQYRNSVKKRSR